MTNNLSQRRSQSQDRLRSSRQLSEHAKLPFGFLSFEFGAVIMATIKATRLSKYPAAEKAIGEAGIFFYAASRTSSSEYSEGTCRQ